MRGAGDRGSGAVRGTPGQRVKAEGVSGDIPYFWHVAE